MPASRPVPAELLRGPFARARALSLGVSERVLEGARFRRPLPRVYVAREHAMSDADWRRAAMLWRPDRAVLSHVSALQELGVPAGATVPVHLTVQSDLHLDVPQVFLHRTRSLPSNDGARVSVEAAMVGAASILTPLDLIGTGDVVLDRSLSSTPALEERARIEPWRPGAFELLGVLPLLRPRAESRRESRTRVLVTVAGLPEPDVNVEVFVHGVLIARVDLLIEEWMLVLEYDGRQHLRDVAQWNRDIVRDQALRDAGYEILHVTHEMLRQPRALVLRVHEALRRRGYRGPEPEFGRRWSWITSTRPSAVPQRRPAVS